jgi:hypothetical protein
MINKALHFHKKYFPHFSYAFDLEISEPLRVAGIAGLSRLLPSPIGVPSVVLIVKSLGVALCISISVPKLVNVVSKVFGVSSVSFARSCVGQNDGAFHSKWLMW